MNDKTSPPNDEQLDHSPDGLVSASPLRLKPTAVAPHDPWNNGQPLDPLDNMHPRTEQAAPSVASGVESGAVYWHNPENGQVWSDVDVRFHCKNTMGWTRVVIPAAPGAAIAARGQEAAAPRYGFLCYSCSHEWEASTPTADCPAEGCGTTNNLNVDHRPASRQEAPAASAAVRISLQEMVSMMDSGDEPGEGSPWHTEAKAALNGTADAGVIVDYRQACDILAMFGGEPGEVTLQRGDGHSGKGLYASYTEYPEEGANYLGETDGEAMPEPSKDMARQGADAARLLTLVRDFIEHRCDKPLQLEAVLNVIDLAKQEADGLAAGEFIMMVKEDANAHSEILSLLGMEEEGDAVKAVGELIAGNARYVFIRDRVQKSVLTGEALDADIDSHIGDTIEGIAKRMFPGGTS